jgi:hypothetical protein
VQVWHSSVGVSEVQHLRSGKYDHPFLSVAGLCSCYSTMVGEEMKRQSFVFGEGGSERDLRLEGRKRSFIRTYQSVCAWYEPYLADLVVLFCISDGKLPLSGILTGLASTSMGCRPLAAW